MAHFYIWETVTIPIEITPTGQLEWLKEAVVSFKQRNTLIEKTTEELGIADDTITVYLSQEETAQFTPGVAVVQVNLYYEDRERDTSEQVQINVLDNLHKELMT